MPKRSCSPLGKKFGKRVGALRTAKNIQQKVLAQGAGISQPMLSRIEDGDREPRISAAFLLAQGLGCKLDELLGDEPPTFTITIV